MTSRFHPLLHPGIPHRSPFEHSDLAIQVSSFRQRTPKVPTAFDQKPFERARDMRSRVMESDHDPNDSSREGRFRGRTRSTVMITGFERDAGLGRPQPAGRNTKRIRD